MVTFDEDIYENFVTHYGVKKRSGRYPWGSGGTELSEARDFQKAFKELRSKGLSNAQIAKSFDMKRVEIDANVAIANIIVKQEKIFRAEKLQRAGMSPTAIGREMGINESSVRALLKDGASQKIDILQNVSDELRKRVDEDGFIDVGKGTFHHLGVTKTKLDVAIAMLETEGYTTHQVGIPQVTNKNETRGRVLGPPGKTWQDANAARRDGKIFPVKVMSDDGGRNIWRVEEPIKVNPDRVQVKYGPEGGSKADGVMYIRPGVPDLSMGSARYAQVRIAVGDKHYLKGMALYDPDLPKGVDIQFNTNKKSTGNKLDAMKEVTDREDPIERFGAIYRQIKDPKTGKNTSAINLVNDESNWDDWSKTIATQMLSKQKPDFVKSQLAVTHANNKARLDEIMALTQPVVRKKLLESFSDDLDSAAAHMKAAALPRQKTHVILPINSLKDNEVYAPNYKNGERVVLIRYPHGGKFEIPELVVNNGNREGKRVLGPATKAAIGINANVAGRLSGADFDGDTVVVIPNNRGRIVNEKPLEGLKGFDPQEEYRGSADGGKTMLPGVGKMGNTQTQMGQITNLITDMTIAGAPNSELVRAVKHSMVVIDAEKHSLDWRRSQEENGIKALKEKYEPGGRGANTIISRSGGDVRGVPHLKPRPEAEGGAINKKTGAKEFVPSGNTRAKLVVNKETGEKEWVRVGVTQNVTRGSRLPGSGVNDAYDLVSSKPGDTRETKGYVVERHYADYSNLTKNLANEARLKMINTPDPKISQSAKKVYAPQVASLKAKLKEAQFNAPLERQAQLAAGVAIRMKRAENPGMQPDEVKRMTASTLQTMRKRVGAEPKRIEFTALEWEAVQNGAVSASVLKEILTKADMKQVTALAQPKAKVLMQPYNIARAKALAKNGNYTRAEIAEELGVSVSTLDRALAGT